MNVRCTTDNALSISDETAIADRQLVARFAQTRDQQAFRELVRRHSRLVFGVCTRVLRNRHDAEEAFQASFMVLAQKADRLEIAHSVGPWLYGVAYRVAVRAARRRSRRRENPLVGDVMAGDDVLEDLTNDHWRQVLDDELNQLPTRYREPLVLHYLFGKTNKEIAAQLGLTVRTVEGRQRRGKERLRRRLALRKVSLPLAIATLAAANQAVEAAPLAPLIEITVKGSLTYVTRKEVASCRDGADHLARKEVCAMNLPVTPLAAVAAAVIFAGAALSLAGSDGAPSTQRGAPLPLTADNENQQQIADEPLRDIAVQLAAATTTAETLPKAVPPTRASESNMFQPRIQSPNERRIHKALATQLRTPLQYVDAPLSDVLAAISEEYGVQIWLDKVACDSLAISPETEVSIDLRQVPLRSALALMLMNPELEELTYLVKNDVLMITSADRAEAQLETRIYNVQSLVSASERTVDELSEVLMSTVRTDSWQLNGTGEGAAQPFGNDLLAINQSQSVHGEVEAFLAELQQHVLNDQ